MKKKSFVMYADHIEQIAMLSDAQAGRLLKALMQFVNTGEEPAFEDGMLQLCYSFLIAQVRRDAEKYEQTCKARSAAGKKGGAPKENRNAAKKQAKQAKQADTDTECETECETETETDTECECVNETVQADTHTAHTEHPHSGLQRTKETREQSALTADKVQAMAKDIGLCWDRQEAEAFLAYNRDKGRTDGWDYAIERWEKERLRRNSGKTAPHSPAPAQQTELDDYLSVVNQFSGFPLSDFRSSEELRRDAVN